MALLVRAFRSSWAEHAAEQHTTTAGKEEFIVYMIVFKFCFPIAVAVAVGCAYRANPKTGVAAFLSLCARKAVEVCDGIFGFIALLICVCWLCGNFELSSSVFAAAVIGVAGVCYKWGWWIAVDMVLQVGWCVHFVFHAYFLVGWFIPGALCPASPTGNEHKTEMFWSTFLFFGTVAAYGRLADAGVLDRFLARELKLSPDAFAELTSFVRAPASYAWPCWSHTFLVCQAICALAGAWFLLTRVASRYQKYGGWLHGRDMRTSLAPTRRSSPATYTSGASESTSTWVVSA